MALALDEPKENDEVFEENGITFLVDKDFLEKAKPITVDFTSMGFNITSSIDLGESSGCGGCGGSCG